MEKPIVIFESSGESGNIYYILGMVRRELQKQRRITTYNEIWQRVNNSSNYKEALAVIREYVDLIDTNCEF